MPARDWSRVDGPVTACYEFGSKRRFTTLVEALHFHGRSWPNTYERVRYYLDEFGMIIPAWKIAEIAAANPRPEPWRARWARRRRHVFRQGPVHGIRCWRGSRRNYYRHISTRVDIRENEFLDYDDDAVDYGIKARGRRRNLPTAWDDVSFARCGRGWKRHRRHQWREEG